MSKKNKYTLLCVGVISLMSIVFSCQKITPKTPKNDQLLDGPIEGLTNEQRARFLKGDAAFNDEIFTSEKGLGPIFVTNSCGSCHAGDGKGHPFTTLTRFGQTDSTGNKFLDKGGPQLQNRSLPGFDPEQIPAGATSAKFTPPANTGLGYIELVSDADIIAMANANLTNADGVRGHPNWNTIPSYVSPVSGAISQAGKYICKFGKKAAVYDLTQQTSGAYNQDMGITSLYVPKDVYTHADIDPEVSVNTISDVVFYLQTLKAPIQRDQDNSLVKNGKQIFINTGCETCHKQTLKTSSSPIEPLSNKEFHPYSDLLLHDMGPGLDDGYTEGTAKTSEWRTPPLWGLGLSPASQGRKYYLLHDGRAQSIEEAIMYHGGEANVSKNKFQALSSDNKRDLIKFLESL